MRLTFDDNWTATVTDDPLRSTPRFDFPGQCVRIAEYADVTEWQRFLVETFGSREWLWDAPDELRFDQAGRELVGAGFRLPYEAADAEDSERLPAAPPVRPGGGLRADEARDFRLEVTTELCRAPGDTALTCLRDLDVLDEPLQARIGIAPVALLVQHGTAVGWSLTDPARYLTTGFAAPAPATRHLLTECLDLITTPLLDEVWDRVPAALDRLRAVEQALRAQREDRHRTDALLSLIADLVEDYADRPTGQKP
jgi:hypothetical protein